MAYGALPAKVAGDPFDLTAYDLIKGDFEAGVPDVFTTKGDIAAATAADAAARLGIGADDSTLVPDASQTTGLAWQTQPAVRVSNSIDIDPGGSTWVALTFDTESYDTDAMHSTASNTGRLTVPTGGDGIYTIGACVEFDTSGDSGTKLIGLQIRLNGTTIIAQTRVDCDMGGGQDLSLVISTYYALVATDYVELLVRTESAVDILAMAAFSPVFWATWQRRA